VRQKVEQAYREHEDEIESRIESFCDLRDAPEERLFQELVFVVLTSQSRARDCWSAAVELESSDILLEGSEEEISEVLFRHDVSYEERKAGQVLEVRRRLRQPTLTDPEPELRLCDRIDGEPGRVRRDLVDSLPGVGMKAASHFLRNVGRGMNLAVLSGYICTALSRMDYLGSPDRPADSEDYLDKERVFRNAAHDMGLDVQELDLAVWCAETGEVFK
jgi:Thermostable 8-oxoguanine DNA glycosylase